MKDYEGPIYRDGLQDADNRHFAQRSTRKNFERQRFKPAFQSSNQFSKPPTQREEKKKQVDTKQQQSQQESGATSTSGLEHYEIPFLKNKDQSVKTVDNSNLPHPNDGFMAYGNGQQSEEDREGELEVVGRTVYTPSYQLKKELDQDKEPFKAIELPKPYREKSEGTQSVKDSNMRELTKRLHKTKDSFLLFENEEAINSNDE